MAESEYHRRNRLAAERALKLAMPDIRKTITAISRQMAPAVDMSEIFSQEYTNWFAQLSDHSLRTKELGNAAVNAARLGMPRLQLDYKSLFPDLVFARQKLLETAMPAVRVMQELQRSQFAGILASVRAAMSAALPPNWRAEGISIPTNLEVLLLDEGLALAWVPTGKVLIKLFAAATPGERRRILGNNWRGITRSCLKELRTIKADDLIEHTQFAVKAATTLLSGYHEGAQALSANLLDTMLRTHLDASDQRTVTSRRSRLDIDAYPLRVAIVLGGIWGSYGEFWVRNGDKVPREFSRHGSAHGVSRRQYSRVNSVIALMHVVSLLKLLETDLRDQESP